MVVEVKRRNLPKRKKRKKERNCSFGSLGTFQNVHITFSDEILLSFRFVLWLNENEREIETAGCSKRVRKRIHRDFNIKTERYFKIF